MTNRELLYSIRAKALSSFYWSNKAVDYYQSRVYNYGAMIEDDLFKSIAKESEILGDVEIERRLGRAIKIEELLVCPLSVNYLLWGSAIITESDKERETLLSFHELIESSIKRNETRARNFFIRRVRDGK